ncbi:MAG: AAA family ATPase, partial [Dehalococcoidia bacterium]
EKAHPDDFNTLLQIMDDGRLTDSHGRHVDFRNTVVILTSNIGTGERQGPLGFVRTSDESEREQLRKRVEQGLKKTFRPEFLNRLDDIIVFEPLKEAEIAQIAELIFDEVRERLAERQVDFRVTDAAKEALLKEGYDPDFGARPMRRIIERRIENELAKRVLGGEFGEGDCVIVDHDGDDGYSFTREGARAEVTVS